MQSIFKWQQRMHQGRYQNCLSFYAVAGQAQSVFSYICCYGGCYDALFQLNRQEEAVLKVTGGLG